MTIQTFETQIAANKRNTVWFFILFSLLLCALAGAFGAMLSEGDPGFILSSVVFAVIAAGIGVLVSYYQGSKIVLSSAGAHEIEKQQDPELWNVVEEMAIAAGTPVPKIYIMNSPAMNAFATGRDPQHAAVAITTGLREKLTRDELQAVMAHEMAHVANFDIRLAMVIAVFAGIIAILSQVIWRSMRLGGARSASRAGGRRGGGAGVLVILIFGLILAAIAPVVAKLLQLAVSREREYLADATAVRLCRNPLALASALKKLVTDTTPLETSNGATEHLYVVNPRMKNDLAMVDSVWSTHPPIDKRIARIMALA